MYQITIDNENIYVENVKFIKNQKNGIVRLCEENEAQGMVSFDNNENWAFEGKGLEDKLNKVVKFKKLTNEEHLALINQELTQQITDIQIALCELYEVGGVE
jgi:hypothetical protein